MDSLEYEAFKGLPSPQGSSTKVKRKSVKSEEKRGIERELINLTEEMEKVKIENKRLAALVRGTPPKLHAGSSNRERSSSKPNFPSSMVIDDLRQMEELTRAADRDLRKFGANCGESAPSDSSDEEAASDNELDNYSKRQGKKSRKLKSGKTARITTRVVKPQLWPHSELSLSYVSKNIGYDDLTIEEFVAGYTTIMNLPQTSTMEQKERLQHLTRLMYLATQYEWNAVRDFHATVLLEIERGSLTWKD